MRRVGEPADRARLSGQRLSKHSPTISLAATAAITPATLSPLHGRPSRRPRPPGLGPLVAYAGRLVAAGALDEYQAIALVLDAAPIGPGFPSEATYIVHRGIAEGARQTRTTR